MPLATFLPSLKGYKGKIFSADSSTNDITYMKNALRDAKSIDSSLDIREGLFNRPAEEHVEFLKKD